jgi:amidase
MDSPQAIPFEIMEASIETLAALQASGAVTARQLVEGFLARVNSYDQEGPQLNSIVTLNTRAREIAAALDQERKEGRVRGPLHGIPLVVKDNFETQDMPTSGGALALATLQPSTDARCVARLKEAGAIILAKTTMHELALGDTTASSLTGVSRNPYDLSRVPGGSSGGTAIAVAASFAAAGIGTDTCGSVRTPAAYQCLFGLRPTQGLLSCEGVIPASSTQDTPGPLARSVADLAILLDALVGTHTSEAAGIAGSGNEGTAFRASLRPGLAGFRIGVIREMIGSQPEDVAVGRVLERALAVMKDAGVGVIDVEIGGLDKLLDESDVAKYEFREELAAYLPLAAPAGPVSVGDILRRGLDYEAAGFREIESEGVIRFRDPAPRDDVAYRQALTGRTALANALRASLEAHRLDALVYPTVQREPGYIGDGFLTAGRQNIALSAQSGFPAIAIPAGFTEKGLPVGIDLLGAPYSEVTLLRFSFAWEMAANPRQPPFSAPPLDRRGVAPKPVFFGATIETQSASAAVKLTYDRLRSVLVGSASIQSSSGETPIALTLQRGYAQECGPILAHVLGLRKARGEFTHTLSARDRADLMEGRLYVHLYTSGAPLGAGRALLLPITSDEDPETETAPVAENDGAHSP